MICANKRVKAFIELLSQVVKELTFNQPRKQVEATVALAELTSILRWIIHQRRFEYKNRRFFLQIF